MYRLEIRQANIKKNIIEENMRVKTRCFCSIVHVLCWKNWRKIKIHDILYSSRLCKHLDYLFTHSDLCLDANLKPHAYIFDVPFSFDLIWFQVSMCPWNEDDISMPEKWVVNWQTMWYWLWKWMQSICVYWNWLFIVFTLPIEHIRALKHSSNIAFAMELSQKQNFIIKPGFIYMVGSIIIRVYWFFG